MDRLPCFTSSFYMAIYTDPDQLYSSLRLLFGRIQQDPAATRSVLAARMAIRLRCTSPGAEVVINGRRQPLQISYGPAVLRPDLDVALSADALHRILLAEMPLRQAIGSGQMVVRGPILKTYPLEAVLHSGQALYPQVLRDLGFAGVR